MIIVTGGTTGLSDGTLVDGSNPIVFPDLSTVINVHIRRSTGNYSLDTRLSLPSALECSIDGVDWRDSSSDIVFPEIGAVNYPIRLRQVAAVPISSASSTLYSFGSDAAVGTLDNVTNFQAVHSGGVVSLSWSAVANRTYYKLERATDSAFTTNLVVLSSTLTAVTYDDSSFSGSTRYFYRIKALGSVHFLDSASYTQCSIMILNETFASLDSNLWATSVSGSQSFGINSGKLVMSGATVVADAGLVALKTPLDLNTNQTYKSLATCSTSGGSQEIMSIRSHASQVPSISSAGTQGALFYVSHTATSLAVYARYNPVGGGYSYWNGSSWVLNTVAMFYQNASVPQDTYFTYIIETSVANGVRFILKSADEQTTITTTAWVPASSITGSGSKYLCYGDPSTTNFIANMSIDSVTIT
ncbi:hypothetical protein HGB25_01470 [Candidatus Saccharibacteria bacterium]|nr:hypothetical protein [Candidatus Saccharibacteria bacterium]